MIINNKDLQFLNIFTTLSDTKTILGDKLLLSIKDGVCYFVQFGVNVKLIKKIEVNSKDNFSLLMNTNQFTQFINSLGENSDLKIINNKIFFKEDTEYSIDPLDISFPEFKNFLDNTDTAIHKTITNFKHLQILKDYLGKDSSNVLSLMDNCFVTMDKSSICIVPTKNDFELKSSKIFFIPTNIFQLIERYNIEQLNISIFDTYWSFVYDGITFIISFKEYEVPYIFSKDLHSRFNHTKKISINRDQFYWALKRMSIFSQYNINSRIYLTFGKENLLIENRDFNKSKERVDILYCDSELQDKMVIISCQNLLKTIDNTKSNEIDIFISIDPNNNSTIRIEDNNEGLIFIHASYKDET